MTVPGSFKGLPADVQAQLDKLEPAIRDAFLEAIGGVADAAKVGEIEDAIARGDVQGAYALLRLDSNSFGQLRQAVAVAYWQGGGSTLVPTAGLGDPFIGGASLGFNAWHPRAEAWTRTRTGALVTAIAEDQKNGIQAFIREGIASGQGPRAVALDIVGRLNRATGKREGGIVGLTGQAMGWVSNARAELDGGNLANYLNRAARDKRFDRMIRTALETGKPLAQADVDKIVQAYASRLLKLRGQAIARTEALNALRAGQFEGWQQQIDSGRIVAADYDVIWDATPDKFTRHSHMMLEGKRVTLGQAFVTENGSRLRFPGDTALGAKAEDIINCRCGFRVRRKRNG